MASRTRTTTAALVLPCLALLAACGSSSKVPQPQDPAPSISSLSPATGPSTGGTTVTILGANLAAGARVTFGGSPSTVISVTAGSVAQVIAPSHGAGAVEVVVTNPDGQSARIASGFTYQAPPPPPAPTISAVSPSSGLVSGGTTVVISGANFVPGTGLAVRFGGVDAASITGVLSGAITAVTPAASAAGAVDVQVVNPDGQSATRAGGFTFDPSPPPPGLPPVLTSIAPTAGTTAGGTAVVLTGQNFVAGAGLVVLFGGKGAAITPSSVTATSITVVTPANAAGPADVTVVNPDGQSVTQPGEFTYQAPPPPAPAVTSISPTSGSTAGGTSVTVSGSNFVSGATVAFGTTTVPATFNGPTSLTAVTPARAAGAVDVTVRNPDNQSATLAGAFTFVAPNPGNPPPVITSINPSSGLSTGGSLCVIAGSGFVAGATPASSSKVSFGGTPATLVAGTVITSTGISVAVPAHASGPVDVTVANPDGQTATVVGGYTYSGPAPLVLALNVRGGPTSGGTQVLAIGSGFVPGVTVTVGGVPATSVSLVTVGVGSTAVSFFTPPHAEGRYDVVVRNPDGQSATVANGFHYGPAPVITAVACGGAGGCASVRRDDPITITGDHFTTGAGEGVQVLFASPDNGQQAFALPEPTPAPSPTQIVVKAPKLDGGVCLPAGPCRYNVVVNNFDGQYGVASTQVIYQ